MKKPDPKVNEMLVEDFNLKAPVGTLVRYWKGAREGEGRTGKVKYPAELLNGHTPVAWIEGASGCIALTHVEIIPTQDASFAEK